MHWGSNSSYVESQEGLKRMTLNKMKKNKRKTALEEHEIISEQEVTEIVCYCTNTEIPYFFEQTFCIVKMRI